MTITTETGLLELCKCGENEEDQEYKNWKKELMRLNPAVSAELKKNKIVKGWKLKLPN